jgi:NAD(P)H-flavin reductase
MPCSPFLFTLAHLTPCRDYFIATAAVYVPCLIYPWARTLFEYGGTQRATLRVEDCGFTRITIPAKFDWKPGQHCFLRFRDFGIHTLSSHPFTICSLPNRNPKEKSELVFYIRHQGGFTSKLYQHALEKPEVSVGVMVDGPYGGIDLQRYYEAEHLLVIAGGSGAGWILPFIELFVRQSCLPLAENDCCCGPDEIVDIEKSQPQIDTKAPGARNFSGSGLLSLRVVLATRDTSSRIWFEQTVGDLLAKYPNARATDIRIQVSLTGEAEKHMNDPVKAGETIITSVSGASSTEEITVQNGDHRASTTIPGKEMHGRPHLPAIIHEEAERVAGAGQALSVYICGPETMQNDVRNAVAAENLEIVKGARSMSGGVYLHSEHFSWA